MKAARRRKGSPADEAGRTMTGTLGVEPTRLWSWLRRAALFPVVEIPGRPTVETAVDLAGVVSEHPTEPLGDESTAVVTLSPRIRGVRRISPVHRSTPRDTFRRTDLTISRLTAGRRLLLAVSPADGGDDGGSDRARPLERSDNWRDGTTNEAGAIATGDPLERPSASS